MNVGWDESLDREVQEEWRLLLKEVVQYPKFVLPRSAKPIDSIGDPDLIAFWDGADPAYAGCIYLRWKVVTKNMSKELRWSSDGSQQGAELTRGRFRIKITRW